MFRIGLAAIALTTLLPLSMQAATITVRSGETLSDIADRYGISVGALMRMNGMRNADHVEVGQVLKLPSNAVLPKPAFKPVAVTPVPGATQHTVAKGQTLTQIAKAYGLPVASLININQLGDPNKVEVGTTLYLRQPGAEPSSTPLASQSVPDQVTVDSTPRQTETPTTAASTTKVEPARVEPTTTVASTTTNDVIAKKADWRTYGPLQVDWANWQVMGGSQVAPTLNAQGQALYLAVNCSAEKINATGADGNWKQWSGPKSSFEKDLVKDRCQAKA